MYTEFISLLNDGQVEKVKYTATADTFSFTTKDGQILHTSNPKYEEFKKDVLSKDVEVEEKSASNFFTDNMTNICTILMCLCLIFSFKKVIAPSKDFGEIAEKSKTTFKDVAGLSEVKADLMNAISFFTESEKYENAGAKLPKGILLYGPPGTGKTLLARAMAGEAKSSFMFVSGSDFSNKFVGVGGDRVRSLFAKAKEKAPCILFIDEIDAVGGIRSSSDTHSEDRNTLNALLSEMDGFKPSEGVLVIGATNRIEDLDPALVRPGRFDNIFSVPLPETASERKEIIDIYIANKKIAEDVDLDILSKQTIGASPAEIESVINEAAILATKRNHGIIRQVDIDDAYLKKILKGHLKTKEGTDRDQDQIKLIAWHEAGHALIGTLFHQNVAKVSIVPSTTGAGGITIFSPSKFGLYSKKELEEQLMSLYAGRCAEEILVGPENITTGASNDIVEATKIISAMVKEYGMCGNQKTSVLNYSAIASDKDILNKLETIADEFYARTMKVLTDNKETLNTLADKLMLKETLSESEIKEIVNAD